MPLVDDGVADVVRESWILWVRPSISAAEFQRHIVDGMRVGVTEQGAYPLTQTLISSELKGEVFRKAIRYVVVDVTLRGIHREKRATGNGGGGPGDRLVGVPGVLQVAP